MLQTQAVEPELLELLNGIMASDVFSDFVLVGGTALALQIGHRKSIDLDFFGKSEIEEASFLNSLSQYGKVKTLRKSKNVLITLVNNIKVDFVNYAYPLIKPAKTTNNIRIASKEDIGAMKLNAITGRGSKKDFIDLFFLLKAYSLNQLLDFYKNKFADGSEFLLMKSLLFFEDADEEETPEMLMDYNWEEIKSVIKKTVEKSFL